MVPAAELGTLAVEQAFPLGPDLNP
jgi:hypothetical protein